MFVRNCISVILVVLISACQQIPKSAQAPLTKAIMVSMQTDLGTVLIEVYPELAPLSAGHFLRYVNEGRFNDGAAAFYRVVRPDNDNGSPAIRVVQGGLLERADDISPVAHESTRQTGLSHVDGALSLARLEPGTGSAGAFFVSVGSNPSLDFGGMRNPDGQGFAVFGRVVEGMELIRSINSTIADAETEDAYVQGQILRQPIFIRSVSSLDNGPN